MTTLMTRREFLRTSALAGGGLLLSIWLPGCGKGERASSTTVGTTSTTAGTTAPSITTTSTTAACPPTSAPPGVDPTTLAAPSLYVAIDGAGTVRITAFKSELGQGIRTAIAMIVAEELDADWSRVIVEQAPFDPRYGSQAVGGSASVSGSYELLREAGATARRLLVETAAEIWGVDPDACTTEASTVIHPDGQQTLSYGELAVPASQRPIPTGVVARKDPAAFRIVGQPTGLCDTPDQVRGAAIYTSDVVLPGMRYAAVAHCPVFGGWPRSHRFGRTVDGVLEAVQISSGIAVVAENTWAAFQGLAALEVDWDPGQGAAVSSEALRAGLSDGFGAPGPDSADYFVPYLPHQAMEPMAGVANVTGDGCEVWAPTQNPQDAAAQASAITGLPLDRITVHVPLVGGRFGRGGINDVVNEAVEVSRAIGAPVKVVWRREDDLRHDWYHAMRVVRATAEGAGVRLETREASGTVPVGAWRSVGEHPNAFAAQSFLAEQAAAAGRDPLEVCLENAPPEGRACINAAAERAGWGSSLPPGSGRGIAYYATFGITHVAQVVEVTVADGRITVNRVHCVVDCGRVVNPDTVAAQMEGGIAFGLTAALHGGVTIVGGGVAERNFDDCPILRFSEMPLIEVTILPSDRPPTGVGEMGVPPIAPAVANAVYAATGQRLRDLPLQLPS